MIEKLTIRNFALIENLSIEFAPGFNVITGETGAGKTIIMQAIGLLLGERASKDLLREGAENCEICAEIKVSKETIRYLSFLKELGISISEDEPMIIRRIITDSVTRNYINDNAVSLQTLKLIGEVLIDTHGPHEHQSLLKNHIQLESLDRFAGLEKELSCCKETYYRWKEAEKIKDEFEKNLPDAREEDYLRHIVQEIKTASPQENELEEISAKHKVAANSQAILEHSGKALKILAESEYSMMERIFELNRIMIALEKFDPAKSGEFSAQIEEIRAKIATLADNLREYATSVEIDEQEFFRIEERIRILTGLKRKYGPEMSDVLKTLSEASEKLALIEKASEKRKENELRISQAFSEFRKCAETLRQKRNDAAAKFARSVIEELKKLGFLKAEFKVDFVESEASPSGMDKVEFMFSANPGESVKPLKHVASSGEISRTMLALKTVLAEAGTVPILIFDEIDSNIGGTTASIVGKELAKLAKSRQLICISHLPQVACEAERHFMVEKKIRNNRTFTEIRCLSEKERTNELARMLGGTEAAMRHAKDILKKKTN